MPMKRRLKRTTKQYIVVSLLSVLIIGGAFIIVYFTIIKNMEVNYKSQIQTLSEKLASSKVFVYEAKEDIPIGTRIGMDSLNYVQVVSSQAQEYYMTKADIGSTALIGITKGMHILNGMISPNIIDSNVREVEYNSFLISSNMKDNDFVDIRLMYPNGEDYIVLSKKSIKNLTLEASNCFLWLTEEEILNMSSAIVDAYLYSGTKLYTAKYIEPNLQEPSVVTYQPSIASLILMEQDENIVDLASKELNKQLRKELEKRLTIEDGNQVSHNVSIPSGEIVQGNEYQLSDENQVTEENQPIGLEQNTNDYFIEEENQDTEDNIEYGG